MAVRSIVIAFVIQVLVGSQASAEPAAAGQYDFAYRVAGDRRVAPVQVFDDGRDTYLQFRAHQTVPAIFGVGPAGERLATHTLNGAYVVVAGTAKEFVMRIGDVSATAQYQGMSRRSGLAAAGRGDDDAADAPASGAGGPKPVARVDAIPAAQPGRALIFDAAVSDRTMRSVMARWARSAGWTFEPEHWAVDVDIPLAGAASFGAEFKAAVRQLLASTELSGRPLQPCFYSNNVVRVIARAESCNRATPVAASH